MIQAARQSVWTLSVSLLLAGGSFGRAEAQQYSPYGDYPTTVTTPGYPTTSLPNYQASPRRPTYYTRPGENRQVAPPWRAPNIAPPPSLNTVQAPPPTYTYAPSQRVPAALDSAFPNRPANQFNPPPAQQFGDPRNATAPPSRSLNATLKLFEPAQRIAQVGDQHILAGDIMGLINQAFEANREAFTNLPPAEVERQKELATRQLLAKTIETKILYVGFLREMRGKTGRQV